MLRAENRRQSGVAAGAPRQMQVNVLVVDDDLELTDLLTRYLSENGSFTVAVADNGEDGLSRILSESFDLVILDIMLPGIDGIEVLRRLRARTEVPVLMLTARFDEVDRVVGLEVGADDYLGKPFNPRELLARMHAILRRARSRNVSGPEGERPESIHVGDISVDMGTRSVLCGSEAVDLTAVEFDLLVTLLRSAGRVVSREDISRKVLSRELMALDRSIDMHVCRVRKKLGTLTGGKDRIKTVRSVGYMYCWGSEDDAIDD